MKTFCFLFGSDTQLTQLVVNERMQKMRDVLEETSGHIRQIQDTVEATQVTVKDIFKSLEGASIC